MTLAIPLLVGLVFVGWADPLDQWHWRNPLPQGNSLAGVTYANGSFVAVGDKGTILTSANGVNWSNQAAITQTRLAAVTYANGTFVAVGENGTVLTSTDTATWINSSPSGAPEQLNGVVFGNGTFVAVGSTLTAGSATILTSSDGAQWSSPSGIPGNYGQIYPAYGNYNAVAYGNNTFVAVGNPGYARPGVSISTNPATWWDSVTTGSSTALRSVVYGNGFVAVGDSGVILTSTNGSQWLPQTSGTSAALYGVTRGNGTYIAVGASGTILSSTDGVTWTDRSIGGNWTIRSLVYGGGRFVAAGDAGLILTSTDGVQWTHADSGSRNPLNDVAHGPGLFVGVGSGGAILTSPDGASWTSCTSGTTNALFGVAYGNGAFVAVGDSGTVLSSANGINNWQAGTSGTSEPLYGVVYGNGTFVAVGTHCGILTSANGITWDQELSVTVPTGGSWDLSYYDLRGVSFGGDTFVAVGADISFPIQSIYGPILTSPDGINWTDRGTDPDHATLNGIAYGDGLFVTVGNAGTWSSSDGIQWTNQNAGPGGSAVAFGNGLFVAVGGNGTMSSSPDGVNWTNRTSGTDWSLGGVAYGNGTFVAVGMNGTILQSGNLSGTATTGSLQVTVTPADAVTAGAQWQVDGGPWQNSGATVSGLTAGTHAVAFSTVSGWTSPASQTVTINSNQTTSITATYVAVVSATRIIGLSGNLAFGNVTVGATAQSTLTIANNGNATLTVNGITYPTGFSGAWSGTVPAGGSQNVTVTFAPAAVTSYGGNLTVTSDATSGNNTLAVSGTGVAGWSDGAPLDQWTVRDTNTITPDTSLFGVTYGNGQFVAVGSGGAIFTSSHGTNWIRRASGTTYNLWGATYAYSSFVAVGDAGTVLTSPDAITWSPETTLVTNTIYGVAAGNGFFIAVGDAGYDEFGLPENYLIGSTLGWADADVAAGANSLFGVCFGKGLFVAVTGLEQVLTSTNGFSWTIRTLGASEALYGVGYGNGTYVAVGGHGTIFTSPDATGWTARTSGTTNDLFAVAYGNGVFLAVGPWDTILSSSDGVSWTSHTSDGNHHLGVTYGDNSFVTVGNWYGILQSGLLTHLPVPWRDEDIGDVGGAAGLAAFTNGLFTVQGSGADIWGTNDAFHFVWEPLNGDGVIVARVTSLQGTDPWAKAGVMIRQSTAPGSPQAMMVVTPGNGTAFQYRPTLHGLSYSLSPNDGVTAPYWVKLVRSGATFTGYKSSDGVMWSRVGSATIAMSSAVEMGLALTAHNYEVVNTAVFDHVQVGVFPTITAFQVTPNAAPVGVPLTVSYTVGDVGGPGLAQVVLWRASGNGSASDPTWAPVQTNAASGSGPMSGSFNDAPATPGSYWYGIVAVDSAGATINGLTAGVEPIQVTVLPAQAPVIVQAVLSGHTFSLSVASAVGRTYVLEYKNSLADLAWTTAQSLPGNDGLVTFSDTGATNPARFYRIRVQ